MSTILIAEDESMNRQLVATLLREHGHRVLEASDGHEMLKMVTEQHVDLVLADILMLGIDIVRCVSALQAMNEAERPGVMLRAAPYVEIEARALAHALGTTFLAKPINPKSLVAALTSALTVPRRRGSDHERRLDAHTIDSLMRSMIGKLCRRAADLEERNGQLAIARSAVDQEIHKRLLAEQELTHAIARLRDQATRDGLTGLYNRNFLEESLSREENRARRSGHPLAILLIDVDNFKRFNDSLGHAAGDAVLRSVGRAIVSGARSEDMVSRYGGDEFVLVMSQVATSTVLDRAEKLRESVRRLQVNFEDQPVGVITVSVGVAIFPEHGDSAQAVFRAADGALYRAKHAGRDAVSLAQSASTSNPH